MTRRQALALLTAPAFAAAPRADLLAKFELVMGPLPKLNSQSPLNIKILTQERFEKYLRLKITYEPEPGRHVFAWLLIPYVKGRKPAALCLHQTTRIGKDEPIGRGPKVNLYYAHELAELGWVALVPDYPGFGDDTTDLDKDVFPRGYASGTMYAIVNHIRGVDLLVGHPEVDRARIVAIGHSLGGHNTLFVSAFDQRIAASATSCGFTAFPKYMKGNLKGWDQKRYMPRVLERYHNNPAEMPFDFDDILSAIAPRALFINAPLHDDNFEVSGVRDVVAKTSSLFPAGKLRVEYPDAAHDFPTPVRLAAYQFLAQAVSKPA